MGFVNYDEIKLVRAEPATEQLHHGLVGGTVDLAGAGPVAQKVHDGHVAQVLAERLGSLLDQAFAVGKEEDIFHPAGLRKLFDQGDCGAGFPVPVAMTSSARRCPAPNRSATACSMVIW